MSHEEQGIAQSQLRASGGNLQKAQDLGTAYLNDRIFLYLGVIAFIGLLVVWATASSPLVLYGSFALAIAMIFIWGYLRIKRTQRIALQRARQAAAMKNEKKQSGG